MSKKIVTFQLKKTITEYVSVQIGSSLDSYNYMKQFYDDIDVQESFYLLLLNRAQKTLGYVKISQGGITGTVVDKLIIAKYVVDSLAKTVILAHNHPSGQLMPSEADINITRGVTDMLKLFDVSVMEHIIMTSDGYYSFCDNCLIN